MHAYVHSCMHTCVHIWLHTITYLIMPTPVVWLFVCLLACFSVCYMVDWFTLGVCGRAFDDSCWKFIVRFYFEHPLTLRQFRCHDGPLLKEVVDNALQSIGGHFFLATSQFVHGVLVKIFTCVSMRHPCFATQLNHFGEMLCFERRSCSTPVTSYP